MEAHHHPVCPDAGRNSGGRQIKKNYVRWALVRCFALAVICANKIKFDMGGVYKHPSWGVDNSLEGFSTWVRQN